jgi:heme A synthase
MDKVKKQANETVEFIKRLAGVIVALSLLGLGAFALVTAHGNHVQINAVALSFSGAVNLFIGAGVFYKVLMRKS